METAKNLLNELREEIEVIDSRLVPLWEERMRLARRAAEYKSGLGLPVLDCEREELLWERWRGFLADPELTEELREFFEAVLSSSKRWQSHFV